MVREVLLIPGLRKLSKMNPLEDRNMNSRNSLFLCFSLLFLIILVGCNGVPSPSSIIEGGSISIPAITLTNLGTTGEPVLLGIGSTFKITWELTNPPESSKVELILDEDGDPHTKDDQIVITPSGGIDGSDGEYDFTPTEAMKDAGLKTAVDYTVIAKLMANGFLYDQELSERKIRIGEGGVTITSPTSDVTKAKGLPIDITWELTNNLCTNLPDKEKIIHLYLDTGTDYNAATSIEITPTDGIDACAGSFELHTGEISDLKLNTAYHIIARLFIDGVEHSRQVSSATITTVASLTVTAPTDDIRENLDNITVSWQVQGRDATGLFVEILAKLPNVQNDPDRIISPEFSATAGTGTADASKLPPGTYEIWVKLFERDSSGEKIELDRAKADGRIIIVGGYTGTYDLSDMSAEEAKHYSPIDGAVFEGFNINDEVGFEVAGVGDIDGDKHSDILIFSRYGQEYTVGNAGSAYLIYGKDDIPSTVKLNSVAAPNEAGRVVDGTLMLLPMENMARDDNGSIKGEYSAIGLPDISGDQKGDLMIGAPDAAPLVFHYANYTDSDATVTDHFGLERQIPKGTAGVEPAHVHPQFHITGPYGSDTRTFSLEYGSALDDEHYMPGDTINVIVRQAASGDTITEVTVDHYRQIRGAVYLLTSQRLSAYRNKVYDLAKIGSPREDGVNDTPSAMGTTYVSFAAGPLERADMITWLGSGDDNPDDGFGSSVSVVEDIDSDGFPELLMTAPRARVEDIANSAFPTRQEAGVLIRLDGNIRPNSIMTGVGKISWMVPEQWWQLGDRFNSEPPNTDGDRTGVKTDILGAQTGSLLDGVAGLGRFEKTDEFGTKYVDGDFNGDSVPDIVVGAPGENGSAGSIYIIPVRSVFGRRVATIDLADFNKEIPIEENPDFEVPILGVKLSGTIAGEKLGQIVKPAGDFNGDGLADVMFATPQADGSGRAEAGRVILMFGQPDVMGDFTVDEVDSHKGTQLPGLIFEGQAPYDHLGTRIVSVGDVNGDGLDDILVAAPDADAPGKNDCGKIYLIYGKKNIIKTDPATGFKYVDYDGDGQPDEFWNVQAIGRLVLNNTPDGTKLPGAVFVGESASDHLQAVSPAGDVNGDGVGDFIIGAPQADVDYGDHFPQDNNAGKAYLIYGRKFVIP